MLVCLLLPTLLYMWAVREPPQRWRAAYFGNERLEGLALVREERDVAHDWKRQGPPHGIPADRFSARWDSCLTLERAQTAALQLTSDDGSRLFVDGLLVIDNWGLRRLPRTRGTDVLLEAGLHHLRVEYSQLTGSASVTLAASLDGKRPRRIAPEHLRFPGGDPQRPCGEIRQSQVERQANGGRYRRILRYHFNLETFLACRTPAVDRERLSPQKCPR